MMASRYETHPRRSGMNGLFDGIRSRRPIAAPTRWRSTRLAGRPLGKLPLYGLCALALTGCATSEDPHEGGFISGVVGLAGGGYQRRIDEREATYGTELDAQERLRREAAAVEAERAAVRSELGRAESRLSSLEARLARQRAALSAQQRSSAAARQRLRRVEQAQAKVSGTRGAIQSAKSGNAPVGDLKAQSRQIQASLDEIDAVVESVSEGTL